MRTLAFLLSIGWIGAVGCGGGEAASSGGSSGGGGTIPSSTLSTGGAGGTAPETTTSTGEAGSGGATTSSATRSTGGGGTGGEGGSGGSGGEGGTGGGTTSTTTTSTPTQVDCTWGDDCGPGKYCFAPGCSNGICIQTPPQAGLPPEPTPVCGCDGATYWNQEVAASKGMSVAMDGACRMVIACGPDMPCPVNMKCSRPVADQASCSGEAMGECWGTPLSCALDGPMARACTTDTCELQCSLVQSQNPWFEDPTCE